MYNQLLLRFRIILLKADENSLFFFPGERRGQRLGTVDIVRRFGEPKPQQERMPKLPRKNRQGAFHSVSPTF